MDGQVLLSNINYLCDKQGISIGQLEKATEIAANTIKRWSTSIPGVDKVEKVALFFDVSIESLISVQLNNEYTDSKESIAENILAKTISNKMVWQKINFYINEDSKKSYAFVRLFSLAQNNLSTEITSEEFEISTFCSIYGYCGFYISKFTKFDKSRSYYALFVYVSVSNTPDSQIDFLSAKNIVKDCYDYIEGEIFNANPQYMFNKFLRDFINFKYFTTDTLPASFDGCYLADDEGKIIFYNEKCLTAYKAKSFFQAYKKLFTIEQSNLGLQKTIPIMKINLTNSGILTMTNANQFTMRINHMKVNDEVSFQILKDVINEIGYEVIVTCQSENSEFCSGDITFRKK